MNKAYNEKTIPEQYPNNTIKIPLVRMTLSGSFRKNTFNWLHSAYFIVYYSEQIQSKSKSKTIYH